MYSKEIKMKPILFSTAMVQVILAGNKTQTRRVVPKRVVDEYRNYEKFREKVSSFAVLPPQGPECDYYLSRARYKVGDILYVRETWFIEPVSKKYGYKADANKYNEVVIDLGDTTTVTLSPDKWQPSLFMPKSAARLFLRVTDVGVEKLLDIRGGGVSREGIVWENNADPVGDFKRLWDSINAKRPGCSWADNPWVFVISFERIEK